MTNVIIAVHLAKIPGESCSSEAGYKDDRIYFWSLGVCLKALLTLYVRLWLKHLKGKRNAGTPTCTQVMGITYVVCLLKKCLYIWQNLVLCLVTDRT